MLHSMRMTDDFPILASVAANPAHPYQLLEHLNNLGLKATRSTLYRRVDGLVSEGLLEAKEERGDRGHIRRNLHLTATGHERLVTEAAEVVRLEPLESPLFALALNCAEVTRTGELPSILKTRMAGAARRLTEEEHALAASAEQPESWNVAARERRIAHIKADIGWLQGVLGRRSVAGRTQRQSGGNSGTRVG
jgi:DNA-binding PadR family transcriptional regulator